MACQNGPEGSEEPGGSEYNMQNKGWVDSGARIVV